MIVFEEQNTTNLRLCSTEHISIQGGRSHFFREGVGMGVGGTDGVLGISKTIGHQILAMSLRIMLELMMTNKWNTL